MTRQHFIIIADIIALLDFISDEDDPGKSTKRYVAETFATRLAKTNPRFDHERFMAACQA